MSGKAAKDMAVGALVGFMSMMPAASGGTIAVIFGIYERLIADLADIRGKLLKDLRFIVPLGAGIVVGLLLCAVLINMLLQDWEVPMMFFFAALILFQLPDIYRMCNRGEEAKPTKANFAAMVAGFAVMVSFLFLGSRESGISLLELDPLDWILLFVIGVVVALSKVVPGLSGAAILLAVGLYTPLMGLIGDMDPSNLLDRALALVPIGIGLVVGALALSKAVDHLIRTRRRSTYFCIFGMMVGSILTVCVDGAAQFSSDMIPATVVCVIIGIAFGYVLSRFSGKYAAETLSEAPRSE